MQTNEDTYMKEPEEEEKKALEKFSESFKIEEHTEKVAQLLNTYPELRETMDKLGKFTLQVR